MRKTFYLSAITVDFSFIITSGYVRATGTCLKSKGLKVIRLHRTTTKKYHLLRDEITQQRET